ncbi:hypothetical protein [Candidatus Accumulibacter aalborgensis]|uniref:hypothetical protein n=1 Tax=Candidatus Accumulibacter aalborgensis TaxID=1860102 RepID=UPI003CCC0A85
MRPHLQPIPPTTPTSLYVSLLSAAFVVDARTDLWDLAREVIAQARRQLARGEAPRKVTMSCGSQRARQKPVAVAHFVATRAAPRGGLCSAIPSIVCSILHPSGPAT